MKYYTDGYTVVSNPSKEGGGYSIVDESGNLVIHEVIKKEDFTNNEAELLGIQKALEIANKGDSISTDSMSILTWVNTGKSKARKDLAEILGKCKELKESKGLNLMWEGRDFNLAGKYNEKFDSAHAWGMNHRDRVKLKKDQRRQMRRDSIKNLLALSNPTEELIDKLEELFFYYQ